MKFDWPLPGGGSEILTWALPYVRMSRFVRNFFRCFATTFSRRLFSTYMNTCVQSCFDKEIVQCLC